MKRIKGPSESSAADEVVIQNDISESEQRNNHHVSEEPKDSNNDSVASDGSDDLEMEPSPCTELSDIQRPYGG